jgi:glycosyltransferase involved in cell wall biosynthesis
VNADACDPEMNAMRNRPSEGATEAPLRVCQVLYSGLGGHGSVALSLLTASGARRWRPLMAFIGVEPVRAAYIEASEAHGATYASFQTTPGKPWMAWWHLWLWLRREKPAAIMLHSLSTVLPCFASRLGSGGRLVVIEHQVPTAKSRSEWIFSALAQALADRVVFLSDESRRLLLEKLGPFGFPGKCLVIPNGVNLADYHPGEASPAGSGATRLGMAGRFAWPKRHDVLLDMLAELSRLRPRHEFTLSLAGTGSTLEAVREAAGRGLGARVEFPGLLDDARLAEWFRSLDIYVHASDAENMCTSILQAMACARPSVATDLPSIRALLLEPATCGLVAAGQSGAAFAGAVLELLDDPAAHARLSAAGRATAEARHGAEAMFQAYHSALTGTSETR